VRSRKSSTYRRRTAVEPDSAPRWQTTHDRGVSDRPGPTRRQGLTASARTTPFSARPTAARGTRRNGTVGRTRLRWRPRYRRRRPA
jgi:hypothetical protein